MVLSRELPHVRCILTEQKRSMTCQTFDLYPRKSLKGSAPTPCVGGWHASAKGAHRHMEVPLHGSPSITLLEPCKLPKPPQGAQEAWYLCTIILSAQFMIYTLIMCLFFIYLLKYRRRNNRYILSTVHFENKTKNGKLTFVEKHYILLNAATFTIWLIALYQWLEKCHCFVIKVRERFSRV